MTLRKSKSAKISILKMHFAPYDEEVSYQNAIYARTTPQRLLKEKYPIFYEYFERKFNSVFSGLVISSEINQLISEEFRNDLFQKYCRMIRSEIESESFYNFVLSEIENKGLPRKKPKKHNLKLNTFNGLVDSLFEIPDLILASLGGLKNFKKVLIKIQGNQEISSAFPGNSLEEREDGNLYKYKKVAKLLKIFELTFPKIKGTQRKACVITDCNVQSFNKWLNSKKKDSITQVNRDKMVKWQSELTKEEIELLTNEINNYLNNLKKLKTKY